MRTCWASKLGDCSGPISREHLISECVLPEKVLVTGPPWCGPKGNVISRASLVAKVLCAGHNSALSEADAGARSAIEALDRYHHVVRERSRMKHKTWRLERISLDGVLLERWLLKTTIGIVTAHGTTSGWRVGGHNPRRPPAQFVEAAFGIRALSAPFGLYAAQRILQSVFDDTDLRVQIICDGEGRVTGAFMRLRGFTFLLWLHDAAAPMVMPASTDLEVDVGGASLLRHPRAYSRDQNRFRSVEIDVAWHEPEEVSAD